MKNKLFATLILALGFLFTVPTMASPGLEKVPKTEQYQSTLTVVDYEFTATQTNSLFVPLVTTAYVKSYSSNLDVTIIIFSTPGLTGNYSPPPNRQGSKNLSYTILENQLATDPGLTYLKLDRFTSPKSTYSC